MSETNPELNELESIAVLDIYATDNNGYDVKIEFAFHETLHYNKDDFYTIVVHQRDEAGYSMGCPESNYYDTLKQAYQAYDRMCKKYNKMDVV